MRRETSASSPCGKRIEPVVTFGCEHARPTGEQPPSRQPAAAVVCHRSGPFDHAKCPARPLTTPSAMSGIRYALRSLFMTPGPALVMVLTLGVAVGASTVIYSVIDM